MDIKNLDFFWKLQLFCCFYLTGLIWTIQSVHYPAYHYIADQKFSLYQSFHTKWITPVVAPFMIIELLTALLLCYFLYKQNWLWALNLASVLALWAVTFFLSVPAHNQLMESYNFEAAQKLITTNWLRTLLWTARSCAFLFWWLK